MQASQEKMKEHFLSKVRSVCVKQEEYHVYDAITKSIDKMNERYRPILPLLAEFSIQSTVWQKDYGHFLILKMRLNFK